MTRLARVLPTLAALAGALGCAPTPEPAPEATLSVASLLGPADAAGFERAIEPREFRFPEDHGPHEGFRTEWWYYTGNLDTEGGRRFGYQLTFFKSALTATPAERTSDWAADHAFMAHFALTDVDGRRFYSDERFGRRAAGLAGAEGPPLRVWLEDWSAQTEGDGMRLVADGGEFALELSLAPGKPPVLQGDAGLSRKGSGEGNASYYYSLTRIPSRGVVTIGAETFEVSGTSWMDREWSTSVLENGQVGWDWFALQLEDDRELMLYQIRRADGSADRHSAGTLVGAEGTSRHLTANDFRLDELDTWTSPEGSTYPAAWRVSVPAAALELEIEPLLADQELRHTFRYWEGAVAAAGTSAGEPVAGRGYVELTGY